MFEFNKTATNSRYRLLKAAVGAKPSFISDSTTTGVSTLPSTTVSSKCACEEWQTKGSLNPALIGLLAFFLVLSFIINLWLTLRIKKLQNSNEQRNAGAVEMPAVPNPVSPQIVDEEIENDLYGVITAPAPRPRL
ncbi:Hypothetical predicted protein [Cloeon dipterum]|uniref:Uncharacterized protein n=1 Tax=Cloeon dipterum TaxID=197152 RepID=A0A8S1D6P8_9INSE|nr:Hypothetical predicted protein [Cloeon dipterum]